MMIAERHEVSAVVIINVSDYMNWWNLIVSYDWESMMSGVYWIKDTVSFEGRSTLV